jgi:hypothetical protein
MKRAKTILTWAIALVTGATLAFSEITVADTLALQFQSTDSVQYQVQSSTNMPSGVWTDLDYVLNGNGGQMLAFDPTGITTAKQYRILIK